MVRRRKRHRLSVDICLEEWFGSRAEKFGHEMEVQGETATGGK